MNETTEYQRPVTPKGTVTIPVEIRRLLEVKPQGKITFRIIQGKKVELVPTMTLEETFGSVKPKIHPLDFGALRESAIEENVQRFTKELNH